MELTVSKFAKKLATPMHTLGCLHVAACPGPLSASSQLVSANGELAWGDTLKSPSQHVRQPITTLHALGDTYTTESCLAPRPTVQTTAHAPCITQCQHACAHVACCVHSPRQRCLMSSRHPQAASLAARTLLSSSRLPLLVSCVRYAGRRPEQAKNGWWVARSSDCGRTPRAELGENIYRSRNAGWGAEPGSLAAAQPTPRTREPCARGSGSCPRAPGAALRPLRLRPPFCRTYHTGQP